MARHRHGPKSLHHGAESFHRRKYPDRHRARGLQSQRRLRQMLVRRECHENFLDDSILKPFRFTFTLKSLRVRNNLESPMAFYFNAFMLQMISSLNFFIFQVFFIMNLL